MVSTDKEAWLTFSYFFIITLLLSDGEKTVRATCDKVQIVTTAVEL